MEQNEVLKALQRNHAAELKLAAERLEGTARHTEIIPSQVLSEMTGHEILLKPENLQVPGSFKIRGAYNKIASLSDEQLARVQASWPGPFTWIMPARATTPSWLTMKVMTPETP